nr:hypothetical protein [Baekduia soli]
MRANGRGRPGRQRQRQRVEVLARERPVALGAVDAVGGPLDLGHRRRPRDDRGDEPGQHRGLAGVPARALLALVQRLREQVPDRARRHVGDRARHHAADALLVQRRRRADERDEGRQDRQRGLEGQRAGVAEAVRRAETGDRVEHQPAAPDPPQGLDGLVALQLLVAGHGHRSRGRHGLGHAHRGPAPASARTPP